MHRESRSHLTIVPRGFQYRAERLHLVIPRVRCSRACTPRLSRFNLSTSDSRLGSLKHCVSHTPCPFREPGARSHLHGKPRRTERCSFVSDFCQETRRLTLPSRLTLSLPFSPSLPPPVAQSDGDRRRAVKHAPVCVHAETVSDFVSRFLRAVRERSRTQ